MSLTEKKFWENYWSNLKLPSVVDPRHSFDRCLARELERVTSGVKGEIFEVGCAPGKWIAHLAKVNGLIPSGIEYSSTGVDLTHENFKILKIQPGQIIAGDFFEVTPAQRFDIVMSLGFIEHFEDPLPIISQHLKWLKPGGLLILGVPNFTGITQFIQHHLDKTLLDKHNLRIMNIDYFRKTGEDLDLKVLEINFLGSFEPDLPIPINRFGNPIQIAIKIFLIVMRSLRKIKVLDNFNSPFISSYILAVYRK